MSIPMSVLPEPVAAAPQVRAVAPSISSAAINDNSALARQQLPTAVSAPSVIAAYSPNIAAPPKQPVRPNVAAASTPFAAQFLSQTSEVSDDDLALFAPRSMPTTVTRNDDADSGAFASPIRITRGEVPAAKSGNARAEPPPQEKQAVAAQQQAQASIAKQVTGLSPAPASVLGTPAVAGSPITVSRSQLASTGSASSASPAAVASGKRQAFALARATVAYEYTERRNATIDRPEGISAVF